MADRQGQAGQAAVEVVTLFEDAIVDVRYLRAGPPSRPRGRIAARVRRRLAGSDSPRRDFTVGRDPRADLPLDRDVDRALPCARFPLVRCHGDGFELTLTRDLVGTITARTTTTARTTATTAAAAIDETLAARIEGGRAQPSATIAGAYSVPLDEGTRAHVDFGATRVLVSRVAAPARAKVAPPLDLAPLRYVLATGGAALALLLLSFAVPEEPRSLALERFAIERVAHVELVPREVAPPKPLAPRGPARAGVSRRRAAASPSGRAGRPNAPDAPRRMAVAGHALTPEAARDLALRSARASGVLGVLDATTGGPLASILSTRDSALGPDATDALGGLAGTEIGDALGVPDGSGLVGSAREGGPGPIGVGAIGGARRGGPWGHAGCDGCEPGRFGRRVARAPDPIGLGEARTVGIDKELIRRVVRRHLVEIKFCYDRGLATHAALAGRVIVQFSIAPTGKVVAAAIQSSTLGDAGVEQCAAAAVRRWEFPAATGGGLAMVTYPFTFTAAGAPP